jgi:hypothetical protein
MPENTTFSPFKTPGSTNVSMTRRVRHSLSQKFQSMTRGESALEAADKVALVGGTISASCTIACAVGAAGAFAVTASGPIAAGALGAVGLFLAAESTYSNRESAHNALQPHVWSYIDDEAPKSINDGNAKDVGAAAISLISDGKPQIKLMDGKFQTAENAFNDFWRSYQESSRALTHLSTRTKPQIERMERILIAAYNNNRKRNKILENAFNPGGAVYDFMRRLMHFGNYMQAPIVVGKVMQKDHTPLIDLAQTVPTISDVRNKLATISDRIEKDDATYKIVQEIMEGR